MICIGTRNAVSFLHLSCLLLRNARNRRLRTFLYPQSAPSLHAALRIQDAKTVLRIYDFCRQRLVS